MPDRRESSPLARIIEQPAIQLADEGAFAWPVNALKFTPEGGRIDVRARLDDGMAEISVAGTGIGIAPADQEAVFEEFRQVGAADKKAEGTGLGLALSRKFIELHGGRIWAKSEVGRGSIFTFTLPLRS